MKKPRQHHHFILNLKKVDDNSSKVYPLTVSQTIKRSNLSEVEKIECRNQLRACLKTNRKFIKDLRSAKKPMMIHEKLMAEKWQLHAASMDKIRKYVRGDIPFLEEEEVIIEEETNEEMSE
jgi:hypothetical protein